MFFAKNPSRRTVLLFLLMIAATACGKSVSRTPISTTEDLSVKAPRALNSSPNAKLDSVSVTDLESDETAGQNNTNSAAPISDAPHALPKGNTGATLSDIRNAARAGQLTCELPDQCNLAVAMVSVVDEMVLERCTGFLISDHEVMTAAHCIQHQAGLKSLSSGKEPKAQNLNCNGFIYFHFAGDGKTALPLTVGCESIEVRAGGEAVGNNDYAILKLDAPVTDRLPLKISNRGFKDQEQAALYRIQLLSDETGTVFNGVQNRLDCQASLGTYFYPELNSSANTMVALGSCPIISGNSGAPVLNQNGEVAALLQGWVKTDAASLDPEQNSELNASAQDGAFGVLALAQQLACISEINAESAKTCVSANASPLLYPAQYLNALTAFDESALPKLSPGQVWTLASNSISNEVVYVSTPECSDDSSFEASQLVYKKGYNRNFQRIWKQDETLSANSLVFTRDLTPSKKRTHKSVFMSAHEGPGTASVTASVTVSATVSVTGALSVSVPSCTTKPAVR